MTSINKSKIGEIRRLKNNEIWKGNDTTIGKL